jgi:hypothetical protein
MKIEEIYELDKNETVFKMVFTNFKKCDSIKDYIDELNILFWNKELLAFRCDVIEEYTNEQGDELVTIVAWLTDKYMNVLSQVY